MTHQGNNLYQAVVPASHVVDPFVSFYISATDGTTTKTLPSVDAAAHAFDISVLPNEPPVIDHISVTPAQVGQEINISAMVTDTTNQVSQVTLYYRKPGQVVYQSISDSFNQTEVVFSAAIPGDFVTTKGVESYLEAEDDYGASAIGGGTLDEPFFIVVGEQHPMLRGIIIHPKPVADLSTTPRSNAAATRAGASTSQDYSKELDETHGYERGERYSLDGILGMPAVVDKPEAYEIELSYQNWLGSKLADEIPILPLVSSGKDEKTISYRKGGTDEISLAMRDALLNLANRFGSAWAANIAKTDVIKQYEIFIGPEFPVGKVRIKAVLKKKGSTKPISTVHRDMGVVFNAFNETDPIYNQTAPLEYEQLKRYVVYDREKIVFEYDTAEWQLYPHDKNVSETVMNFVSELDLSDRSSPKKVAKYLTAKANDMMCGCWNNNWNTCTHKEQKGPCKGTIGWNNFNGVKTIVDEYNNKGKPVNYAQCFVYGAVVNSFFRSSGIPSRTVRNGAKRENLEWWKGSLSFKKEESDKTTQYDTSESGKEWNFHVWNEAYISGKQIGWTIYDGSYDAKFYEPIEADLIDIKNEFNKDGYTDRNTDPARHVHQEVNIDATSEYNRKHISTTLFSTVVPQGGKAKYADWKNRVDDYRPAANNLTTTNNLTRAANQETLSNVEIEVLVASEINLGANVPFSAQITNNAPNPDFTIVVEVFNAMPTPAGEGQLTPIFSDNEDIVLPSGSSYNYSNTVLFSEYQYSGEYSIKVKVIEQVANTSSIGSANFTVSGLTLEYNAPQIVGRGEYFTFTTTVHNKYQQTVSDVNVKLGIDGDVFTVNEPISYPNQNIAAGGSQVYSWNITPNKGGEHRIGVIAQSPTIGSNSDGYYLSVIDSDLGITIDSVNYVEKGVAFVVTATVTNYGTGETGGQVDLNLGSGLSTSDSTSVSFGNIQPEDSQVFSWNVLANQVGSWTATVTVTDSDNRSKLASRIIDVYSYPHDLTISSDQNEVSIGSQTAVVNITVTNLGSQDDSVTLSVSNPANVAVSLLDDGITPIEGPIVVSANGTKTINCTLTPVQEHISGTLVVTAQSLLDPSAINAVPIILLDANSSTPQFTISTVEIAETASTVTLTVSRVGGTNGELTVNYATTDGTATDGSDYIGATGTLTWADGEGHDQTLTVTILNNAETESDETFTVTLSDPNSGESLDTATVTIKEAEPTLVTLVDFTATALETEILLEWQTVFELDNAGFHLWRATGEGWKSGDYSTVIRLTEQLLPAQGHWSLYSYIDDDVESELTYYYGLEDFDWYGYSTFHWDYIDSATAK